MKHYKSVQFLSNLQNVTPTCTNVKPPYWRPFGDSSACSNVCSELITTFTNFLGFNQLKITYLQTRKDKVIYAR